MEFQQKLVYIALVVLLVLGGRLGSQLIVPHATAAHHEKQKTVMSDQHLIKLAKAQVVAYNEKDWKKLADIVTADFVYDEVATHRKTVDVDQLLEVMQGWAATFPDSHGTVENAFVGSGKVVLEVTWRGTHTDPMQTPNGEIPATGKSFEVRACQIIEIEGRQIKSIWHYFDMMTMMQQLGLAG